MVSITPHHVTSLNIIHIAFFLLLFSIHLLTNIAAHFAFNRSAPPHCFIHFLCVLLLLTNITAHFAFSRSGLPHWFPTRQQARPRKHANNRVWHTMYDGWIDGSKKGWFKFMWWLYVFWNILFGPLRDKHLSWYSHGSHLWSPGGWLAGLATLVVTRAILSLDTRFPCFDFLSTNINLKHLWCFIREGVQIRGGGGGPLPGWFGPFFY